MNGLVKMVSYKSGYGFIAPLIGKPGSTPDVFFHIGQCASGMVPPVGAEVRFKLVRAEDGRSQAASIELVEVSAGRLERQAAATTEISDSR